MIHTCIIQPTTKTKMRAKQPWNNTLSEALVRSGVITVMGRAKDRQSRHVKEIPAGMVKVDWHRAGLLPARIYRPQKTKI